MATNDTDKSILAIDLDRLEKEWMNQPQLVYKYNTLIADAKLELDRARSASDILAAELDRKIRADPAKYELDPKKITEGGIKAAIQKRASYQQAQEEVLDKKHKVDILSAFCLALEHRKRALEGLVTLHGQQYWAKPNLKGDMGSNVARTLEDKELRSRRREAESKDRE